MEDPSENLEDYLRKSVKIDPLDIKGEFIRIPADLAFWNGRYADALREFLMAKADLEILKAQLMPLVRQALLDKGAKVTESIIESAVDGDAQVVEARDRLVNAEVEKARLYGTLDAIRSKKEMLISLGAHLRAELEGDPSLRDQHRHA